MYGYFKLFVDYAVNTSDSELVVEEAVWGSEGLCNGKYINITLMTVTSAVLICMVFILI